MLHQIKHRFTGAVLFECAVPNDVASGLRTRYALQQATAKRANLSYANLSDANLRGANLRDANLRDANLSDANLRDADLHYANLRGANLSDANLRGANLSDANLRGANLRDANLRYANLSYANLSDANLRYANLSDANLSYANLSDANLSDAGTATTEQSIANLDRVREIILDNKARLEMDHWHVDEQWRNRTCAEEMLCETTHCLAGWLQVCSTDPKVRNMEPVLAGVVTAPIAAKMFYRGTDEVLSWLTDRKYVSEIAEHAKRDAERAASK